MSSGARVLWSLRRSWWTRKLEQKSRDFQVSMKSFRLLALYSSMLSLKETYLALVNLRKNSQRCKNELVILERKWNGLVVSKPWEWERIERVRLRESLRWKLGEQGGMVFLVKTVKWRGREREYGFHAREEQKRKASCMGLSCKSICLKLVIVLELATNVRSNPYKMARRPSSFSLAFSRLAL